MTHYQISMKNEAAFDKSKWLWYVSTWPSSCAEKLKEITWQTKGKCSYKEPYFCKWTIKKARVSLFAWGSSLTAWYVALALSSSSVLSGEKKKETRAQPLSRHFLANNKQQKQSWIVSMSFTALSADYTCLRWALIGSVLQRTVK